MEKDLYSQVHDQLFVNGSCEFNTWYPVHLALDGDETDGEAAIQNRGEIRIRKHIKDNIYYRFRFTKKHELALEGKFEFADETPWFGVPVYFFNGHKMYG